MNSKITLGIFLIIAVIASLFIGSTIGQARYTDLSEYGLIIFLLLYLGYLYRFTWQIILLIFSSGARFNFGFAITSTHISILLLFVYGGLIFLYKKNPFPRPEIFPKIRVGRLVFFIAALLGFGVFSFVVNKIMPYSGGDYATKNMLKGYFDGFVPALFLFVALLFPYSFRISEKVIPTVITMFLIGSSINLAHLAYLYSQGYGGSDILLSNDDASMFYIPLINATFGAMTLRGIGPLAVLLSFMILSYPGVLSVRSRYLKIAAICLLGVGLLGSVMSGGRAAVLQSLFYLVLVAVIYRRIFLVFGAMMAFVVVVVVANIFSSYINNKAPTFVARPLQYVMIEKGRAMTTIENSSDYRTELFLAGIEEWQSAPRITLIGRSVYVPLDLDQQKRYLGDLGAFLTVNLASATCHALLPSVLVQYGIVGTVLYYLVYLLIVRYFWNIHKIVKSGNYSNELIILSLFALITVGFGLIVNTIGGGWFGIYQVLMVVLLKSVASRDENKARQDFARENSANLSTQA